MRVAVAVFMIALVAVAFAAEAKPQPMAKPFWDWIRRAAQTVLPIARQVAPSILPRLGGFGNFLGGFLGGNN